MQFSDPENPFNMVTKKFDVPSVSMSQYPITYDQFQVFIDAPDGFHNAKWREGLSASADHKKQPGNQHTKIGLHPRENVSWYDAVAFCRWLSEKYDQDMRLPTEWEWQRAAQGNDGRLFPWGNEFSASKCNMLDSGTERKTTPVNKHYPSTFTPFGVDDLVGNVWEWRLNTYAPPFSTSLSGDSHRQARGGDFNSVQEWVTTTYRGFGYNIAPDYRGDGVGFRVIMISHLEIK